MSEGATPGTAARRARGDETPWRAKIVEILSDGEWHDGRAVLTEAMRKIPPGVAQRVVEEERTRLSASAERVRPLPMEKQIRSGKRRIMTRVVRASCGVTGTWETDPPWPVGGLFDKSWRLRSVEAASLNVSEVAAHIGVTASQLRVVMKAHPELPSRVERGIRRVAPSDLEVWTTTVRAWLESMSERRSEANRRAAQTRRMAAGDKFVEAVLGPDPDGVDPAERLRRLAKKAEHVEVLEAEVASMRRAFAIIQHAAERADPSWWSRLERRFADDGIILAVPHRGTSHRV